MIFVLPLGLVCSVVACHQVCSLGVVTCALSRGNGTGCTFEISVIKVSHRSEVA